MPEAIECSVEPPAPLTRSQVREACRLAFLSDRAKLTELSEQHGIPYDTLTTWSGSERWSETKKVVQTDAGQKMASELADWLAKERLEQVKIGLSRARRLEKAADEVLERGSVEVMSSEGPIELRIGPKDLQALAIVNRECDMQARRNLGMSEASAGPTLNVNVLGSVELGGWGA